MWAHLSLPPLPQSPRSRSPTTCFFSCAPRLLVFSITSSPAILNSVYTLHCDGPSPPLLASVPPVAVLDFLHYSSSLSLPGSGAAISSDSPLVLNSREREKNKEPSSPSGESLERFVCGSNSGFDKAFSDTALELGQEMVSGERVHYLNGVLTGAEGNCHWCRPCKEIKAHLEWSFRRLQENGLMSEREMLKG